MHMKLKVILIIGLFILCLSAPALADRVDYMDVTYGEDQNGNPRALNVHFDKVVESDTSDIFSPVNFPSDKYKFITLYFTLINPSDKAVRYEFNVSLRDQANRYFHTDPVIDTVPAEQKYNRVSYFAVYRNSTNLQIVWTDKEVNPPWFHYDTIIDINFQDITSTPSATVTPTPTATPTPTQAPSAHGCLPFLPIGLIIGCVGGLGLLAKHHRNGR
jgi:hypothetical protein